MTTRSEAPEAPVAPPAEDEGWRWTQADKEDAARELERAYPDREWQYK